MAGTLCAALAGVLLSGAAAGAKRRDDDRWTVAVTLPSTRLFAFSRSFTSPPGRVLARAARGLERGESTLSLNLNNTQVLSLSDFTNGVTSVDRVVTLLASNT